MKSSSWVGHFLNRQSRKVSESFRIDKLTTNPHLDGLCYIHKNHRQGVEVWGKQSSEYSSSFV